MQLFYLIPLIPAFIVGILTFMPDGLIPSLPQGALDAMDTIVDKMTEAVPIVDFFVSWDLITTLFWIVLGIEAFDIAYSSIMFILRKIPALGINN